MISFQNHPTPSLCWHSTYKDFAKAMDSWGRHKSRGSAFSDVLEMITCELTPHWINEEGRYEGKYTSQYLEIVKRYEPDHVRKYYPPVYQTLLACYDHFVTPDGGWGDPLGDYLQTEIGSNKSKQMTGQFFTPPHICTLMSALVAGNQGPEKLSGLKVSDPACGSARTLIDFDRQAGPDNHNFYYGMDIDWQCVLAASINLFFHGMKGVILHADTLSLEIWGGFRIWHPATGMGISRLTAEEARQYVFQTPNVSHEKASTENPMSVPSFEKRAQLVGETGKIKPSVVKTDLGQLSLF